MTHASDTLYTAITFAPIQGFIEKSRKLRDLYGSSYLLSFLSQSVCLAAEQHEDCKVISPALPNITQGMPNQIIIQGDFPCDAAETSFFIAWEAVTETCRRWIECNVKGDIVGDKNEWTYQYWKRDWGLWAKYAWEFFWVQGKPGESITEVRQRLNERKRSRNWTGINWQGESSTLSGMDAIAWAELGNPKDPRQSNYQQDKQKIQKFYFYLSLELGKAFIAITPNWDVSEIRATPELGLIQNDLQKWQQEYPKAFPKLDDLTESALKQLWWSKQYGEAFVDPREELSIPELTKRLITHKAIVQDLITDLREKAKKKVEEGVSQTERINSLTSELDQLLKEIDRDLNPKTFRDLNRLPQKSSSDRQNKKYWTGWFMGDGDDASRYLKELGLKDRQTEEKEIAEFSYQMRQWGKTLKDQQKLCLPQEGQGRVIYAGGDDFLGVLYQADSQLAPRVCFNWLSTFKSQIWNALGSDSPGQQRLAKPIKQSEQPKLAAQLTHPNSNLKPINVSVGFIWTAPNVPQREVLQQCREAEKSAKQGGKDRIAFRILFNSGNYLEWLCPWWLLEEGLLQSYCDRNNITGENANWAHIYNDVAVLESRHAFKGAQTEVAFGLVEIYFGQRFRALLEDKKHRWNKEDDNKRRLFTGILGKKEKYSNTNATEPDSQRVSEAINNWVINLAKVGFYLLDKEYKAESP
jgi:CRISPR-associated protein Cmr2